MKQLQGHDADGEVFAASAQERAKGMLVEARQRGETVRDEGDFLARALDQIYMEASRERRARGRRRTVS
jgi:hypothetical protein